MELEIELTGGVKLQRQFVLARQDRFLLLADAVLSPQPGNFAYRGVLPLFPQVEFRGAEESREGFLCPLPERQLPGEIRHLPAFGPVDAASNARMAGGATRR